MGKRLRNAICENCGGHTRASRPTVKSCPNCTRKIPKAIVKEIANKILNELNEEIGD